MHTNKVKGHNSARHPCEANNSMNNGRFLQPLIERLLFYIGLQQTLAYTSICSYYRKDRRWLIEQHALVNCVLAGHFAGNISPKHWRAYVYNMADLAVLPTTVEHLKFFFQLNQSLENVTLPPALTRLTFGRDFNQSLENVTLPQALTRLTFGRDFDQSLDNVTLPPTLTHLTFGRHFNQRCRRR